MNIMQKTLGTVVQMVIDRAMGSGLMQQETTASGERYITPGISELIRQAGAEGCVLLKNDGVLPLDMKDEVAVFGRCQLDWFNVGYGSGGDAHAPYCVNLMDALKNNGARYNKPLATAYRVWTEMPENEVWHGWWGHWPFSHPEMPLDPELVRYAASSAQTAIVVIGRAAGEDRDNVLEKGSYFLTTAEKAMLDVVTSNFRHTVVVMDIGGVMESGNAVFDVLYGKVNPCGKLPDTIARNYEDYPSAANFGNKSYNDYAEGIFVGYRYFDRQPDCVLWPFGFGLSYTSFALESIEFQRDHVTVEITNIGNVRGKEVVQLYCRQAKGRMEKAERVLVAFAKTQELEPGDSEICTLFFDDKSIASYDENLHAFVLEPGAYVFEANETFVGSFAILEQIIVEQCEAICSPEVDLRKRILKHLPSGIAVTGDQGITLDDVKEGKATLDAFVAQLSMAELEALTRGHGMMNSSLGTPGNAGVFGGVIPSLQQKRHSPDHML